MKFIAAFAIIVVVSYQTFAGNVEEKTKLLSHLLDNYNEDVEPEHPDLKFNIGLLCATYDHEDRVLKTSAWERYQWKDSRLTWNPPDYGGVNVLRVSSDNLWLPDFKLYNSITHEDKRQGSKCVVYHDGKVIWVPAVQYKSLCKHNNNSLDCTYKIGSWTEDAVILPLTTWGELPVLSYYFNHTCPLLPTVHSETVTTLHYPCCAEPYSSLKVDVTYTFNPEVPQGHKHGHGHGHEHGHGHGHN